VQIHRVGSPGSRLLSRILDEVVVSQVSTELYHLGFQVSMAYYSTE
jgi:hypothetical protein